MKQRPTGREGKQPEADTLAAHQRAHQRPMAVQALANWAPGNATDAVCRVHQDQLVHQVNQENQESQVHLVYQDPLVNHHNSLAKSSLHLHANRVHLVHQVHPAHLVHPETLAIKEHLDVQALMLHQDHQDPLAHLVHQAPLEPTDHLAMLVPLLKANPLSLESLVMLAMLVLLDLLGHPAMLEPMVNPDNQVQKARRVHQAHPVRMVNQVHPVHLAPQVPQERRVFVQNIAPWTVVCSSKMERGDKRLGHKDHLHSILDSVSRWIMEMEMVNYYIIKITTNKSTNIFRSSITKTSFSTPILSCFFLPKVVSRQNFLVLCSYGAYSAYRFDLTLFFVSNRCVFSSKIISFCF